MVSLDAKTGLLDLEGYGISAAIGIQRVGGKDHFYRQLLGDFLAEYGEGEQRLLEAQKRGDWALVKEITHSLQGIAGNLGALELEAMAKDTSEALKTFRYGSLDLEPVLVQLRLVLAGISSLGYSQPNRSEGKQSKQNFDKKYLAGEIDELVRMLQQGDSAAQKTIVRCLDLLAGQATPKQLQRLLQQVDGYEFDLALVTMKEITGRPLDAL